MAGLDMFEISVYPNPSKGVVNLEVFNPQYSEVFIEIFNPNNKLVYVKQLNTASSYSNNSINISQLPHGLYIIQIKNKNFVRTLLLSKID